MRKPIHFAPWRWKSGLTIQFLQSVTERFCYILRLTKVQRNDRLISMGVEGRDLTNVRRALQFDQPFKLIDRVAKHYRIPPQKLFEKGGYGSEARNVAMWLLRQKGALTLREIGLLFGGIEYAAVSQRIRRLDREIVKREQLRQTCEMLNV